MPAIAPLTAPPQSQEQLLAQAQRLAGYSLGELAALAGVPIPRDLKRDKGWIGILLEIWLGASAGSKPEQDFAALGVELKTIPIDRQGRPLETTFVCVAPLTGNSGVTWESSHVRHKLQRVSVDPGRRRTRDPARATPRRRAAIMDARRGRRSPAAHGLGRVDGFDRTRPG